MAEARHERAHCLAEVEPEQDHERVEGEGLSFVLGVAGALVVQFRWAVERNASPNLLRPPTASSVAEGEVVVRIAHCSELLESYVGPALACRHRRTCLHPSAEEAP